MFEICIHGRGGQGVVTAAELLARAAFADGLQVQAIPSFGSERTGAPVVSYCRLDARPILTREPIFAPDAVIVQDPTLLRSIDPFHGLVAGGLAIVNTTRGPHEVGELCPGVPVQQITVLPADAIVMAHLGQPKPSVAMLGAFVALCELVSLDALIGVVEQRFRGKVAAGNVAAARAAHDWVLDHRGEVAGAAAGGLGTTGTGAHGG